MSVERDRLFGTDLELRDVSWGMDLVRAQGDLELTSGREAIVQALRLRLVVRHGELAPLGWPDYGSRLHELVGEPNVVRRQARALAYARQAIEADPRVEAITRIAATVPPGDRDVVRIDIDVQLISSPTPLNLVVDIPQGAA